MGTLTNVFLFRILYMVLFWALVGKYQSHSEEWRRVGIFFFFSGFLTVATLRFGMT